MYIGEQQHISPLRYPIQSQRSPQNDFNQTILANNLYQQIVDKNKNNYLLNSNFSLSNNSINRTISNSNSNNDQYFSSYTSNVFNIQLSSLESKYKENREIYSIVEDQNTNISTKINEINQSIQQLRTEIEKFSSYQMNSILQPLSNRNKTNRNEIESFSSNFQASHIQLLNKQLKDINSSVFIFNDKFQMNSNNFTKNDFPSLRREVTKILNGIKTNTKRIDKGDNILDQRILNEYMKIDKFYEDVNSKISKNFEFFENNINGQFITVTDEISDILKSTSNDRQKIVLSYQQQIEGIQNNVKNSMVQFHSNLKNFQSENSLILNKLKDSITKSLNILQDECSQFIVNLNNSYDQAIDESGNNFNVFHNEMVKTINLIKQKNEQENTSILNVIELELKTQNDFLNETTDKIAKFVFALNDQCELNLKKCQKNSIENEKNGIEFLKGLFEETIKPSLKPLKEIDSKLDLVEKRIVDCENSLYEKVTKMKVNITQSNEKMIEISKKLDNVRQHQKERLDMIESDLRRVEIERNTLANDKRLIPSEYIEKAELKFSEELDKKTIELEYKFEQLKYFIHNIDPFKTNSSSYKDKKEKSDTDKKIIETKENKNSIKSEVESENLSNSNLSQNSTDSNNDTKVFSTSQLYSEPRDAYSCSNDESEETEETYSTNTLIENPKNNQNQNIEQNKIVNSNQQASKPQNEGWSSFSDSEADDEGTDEFTFNNKSLNNSMKNS